MNPNLSAPDLLLNPTDDLVRSFLQSMLDHLPLAIFCKDARNDYQIVFGNSAYARMLGRSALEIIGTTDFDNHEPAEAEFFRKIDIEVMKSGKTFYVPEEPATVDGEQLSLRTWKIPLYAEDGQPQWLLGFCQDITEMKKNEQSARQQAAELVVGLAREALQNLRDGDSASTERLLEQILSIAATTPSK